MLSNRSNTVDLFNCPKEIFAQLCATCVGCSESTMTVVMVQEWFSVYIVTSCLEEVEMVYTGLLCCELRTALNQKL